MMSGEIVGWSSHVAVSLGAAVHSEVSALDADRLHREHRGETRSSAAHIVRLRSQRASQKLPTWGAPSLIY
jgi:hypothetical protein